MKADVFGFTFNPSIEDENMKVSKYSFLWITVTTKISPQLFALLAIISQVKRFTKRDNRICIEFTVLSDD